MSSNFEIEQSGRLLNVESPLGDNKLILTRFRGTETLSGLFTFELEMVSPDHDIQPEEILGKGISWSVRKAGGTRRPFHGIVGGLSGGGSFGRGYRWYTVEVHPAFWLLTHNENCRVFQQKTVPDILQAVTSPFPDLVLDLGGIAGSHPPRDYCVQYKETDFTFLSRLMEDEGLFYYFKHAEGSHTMMVADSNSTFFDCLDREATFGVNPDVEEFVARWLPKRKFRAGKWTQRDYNFKTPSNTLQSTVNTLLNVPTFKAFERFDYPGGYTTNGQGDQKTRVRMEAEESGFQDVEAESTASGFATGGRFTLGSHEIAAESGKTYFVTSVNHEATDYSHVTSEGSGEAPRYRNSFTCQTDQNNYRDECRTSRPVIIGLQQAVVTGGSGDEICTDEFGRIKVHFHWDRFGADDETSSCWVHVVQPWAGAQWGAQFIPRVGMEVAVAFYNGDPDYPVVVGCVYNGLNGTPYSLPDNKTQSGIKSRSSTGGSSDNFNELRFEDKKGSEEISIQAEKDMTTLVKHDETRTIKNNQALTVTQDRTITVKQGNVTETVEQGNVSATIQQGSRTVELNMGSDQLTLDQGDLTIQVSMGSVSITAMQGITLTVGQSSLSITQTGITLNGMNMTMSGTLQTQISGTMTTLSGSATTTVSGGIIMIG